MDGLFDESFCELLWIPDRGRGQDELRRCAVKICHAFDAPDHVGDVRAEDSSIGMSLINDDELQVREELQPVGVMRQDARVQHIGVGQHDARVLADGGAILLRSIAIVDRRGKALRAGRQVVTIGLQVRELILR